jgi:hypothetical protein
VIVTDPASLATTVVSLLVPRFERGAGVAAPSRGAATAGPRPPGAAVELLYQTVKGRLLADARAAAPLLVAEGRPSNPDARQALETVLTHAIAADDAFAAAVEHLAAEAAAAALG